MSLWNRPSCETWWTVAMAIVPPLLIPFGLDDYHRDSWKTGVVLAQVSYFACLQVAQRRSGYFAIIAGLILYCERMIPDSLGQDAREVTALLISDVLGITLFAGLLIGERKRRMQITLRELALLILAMCIMLAVVRDLYHREPETWYFGAELYVYVGLFAYAIPASLLVGTLEAKWMSVAGKVAVGAFLAGIGIGVDAIAGPWSAIGVHALVLLGALSVRKYCQMIDSRREAQLPVAGHEHIMPKS